MYDRLNESNNSNDGKDIKHVQGNTTEEKVVRKARLRQKQKKTGVPKQKI